MEKLKNVFRPGHDKDDEKMYDTTKDQDVSQPTSTTAATNTATSSAPVASSTSKPTTTIPSTTPITTSTQHDYLPQVPNSQGLLFDPNSPTNPVGGDAAVRGTQVTPVMLKPSRDDTSDLSLKSGVEGPFASSAATTAATAPGADALRSDAEASKPDYTGITPGQNLSDRVAERDRLNEESEAQSSRIAATHPSILPTSSNIGNESSFARDPTTGDITAVSAADEAPRDPEVDNATYTERKFTVGGPSSETTLPTRPPLGATVPSMPHIPGEFPADNGLDPHELRSTGLAGADDTNATAAAATASAMHPGGMEYPAATTTSTTGAATAPTEPATEHNYGRDAAIGGAGGAAAAAAAYAAYENTSQPQSSAAVPSTGVSQAQAVPTTSQSNVAPVSTTAATAPTTGSEVQPTQEHHYGRDAAVVGGVGAAGAGGYGLYEAGKDQAVPAQQGTLAQTTAQQPVSTTSQTTSDTAPGAVPASSQTRETAPTQAPEEHQYGRDAAIAGGAGAAGAAGTYGVWEAAKDPATESNATTFQPTQAQPISSQAAQTTQTAAAPSYGTTGTTAPTTATTTEAGQQEQEQHYGRDAALAGGAAGATGLGAAGVYEATREPSVDPAPTGDQGPMTSSAAHTSQPVSAPEAGPASGAAPGTAVGGQELDQGQEQEHHYGRDAAIAGGAAGVTGLGAAGVYEATRDSPAAAAAGAGSAVAPSSQQVQQEAAQQQTAQQAQQTPQRTPSKLKKTPPEQRKRDEQEQQARQEQARQEEARQEQVRQEQLRQEQLRQEQQQQQQPKFSEDRDTRPSYESENTKPHAAEDLETSHHNKVITDAKGHSKLHKKKVEVPTHTSSPSAEGGSGYGRESGNYDDGAYRNEEEYDRARESRDSGADERGSGTASSGGGREAGERKHGLLSKILHPNRTKREKEEAEAETAAVEEDER